MRQGITGDVIYTEIDKLPNGLIKLEGNLIHKGEQHHHVIKGDFELYGNKQTEYIIANSDCELLHDEHDTVSLPKGIWHKTIQKEYDHFEEESREVID